MRPVHVVALLALVSLSACGSDPRAPALADEEGDLDTATDTDDVGGDLELQGDDDPTVTTSALVVTSAGAELGRLVSLDEFTITVWDPTRSILFTVNDSTGFVTSREPWYDVAGCAGHAYDLTSYCSGTPARSRVIGIGGDFLGLERADGLMRTGALSPFPPASRVRDGACVAAAGSGYCGALLEAYGEIPTAFALPIAIVEQAEGP